MKKYFFPIFICSILLLSGCSNSVTQDSVSNRTVLNDNIFQNFPNVSSEYFVYEDLEYSNFSEETLILTSFFSNTSSFLTYSEVDYCFLDWKDDPYVNNMNCHPKYNIYVKNVVTGETDNIYSFDFSSLVTQGSFFPVAHAGGCKMVPFPIFWSNNDESVIFEDVNLTNCGSGAFSSFLYNIYNLQEKTMLPLATMGAEFSLDKGLVVYLDNSETSPRTCGPDENNKGKIVVRNLENANTIYTLQEDNTRYSGINFDYEMRKIYYKKQLVAENEYGCSIDANDLVTENHFSIKN